MSFTVDDIKKWLQNESINPKTGRHIKKHGPTYEKLLDTYFSYLEKNIYFGETLDRYQRMRRDKIDPILLIDLPYGEYQLDDYFKFEYKWDPFTGERLNKDPDGALYFDPDTLINYFYINRLNNLWINGQNGYHGYYGDAISNGPDFYINGRGYHPEWYLFRLPIQDCYLPEDYNQQYITMGPILTDEEIIQIDNLAKKFGKYHYNKKRPSLFEIKKLYDQAISKTPNLGIDSEIEFYMESFEPLQISILRRKTNIIAIEMLKQI